MNWRMVFALILCLTVGGLYAIGAVNAHGDGGQGHDQHQGLGKGHDGGDKPPKEHPKPPKDKPKPEPPKPPKDKPKPDDSKPGVSKDLEGSEEEYEGFVWRVIDPLMPGQYWKAWDLDIGAVGYRTERDCRRAVKILNGGRTENKYYCVIVPE